MPYLFFAADWAILGDLIDDFFEHQIDDLVFASDLENVQEGCAKVDGVVENVGGIFLEETSSHGSAFDGGLVIVIHDVSHQLEVKSPKFNKKDFYANAFREPATPGTSSHLPQTCHLPKILPPPANLPPSEHPPTGSKPATFGTSSHLQQTCHLLNILPPPVSLPPPEHPQI